MALSYKHVPFLAKMIYLGMFVTAASVGMCIYVDFQLRHMHKDLQHIEQNLDLIQPAAMQPSQQQTHTNKPLLPNQPSPPVTEDSVERKMQKLDGLIQEYQQLIEKEKSAK